MNALSQKLLCGSNESTADDDDRGSTITCLNILGLGKLNQLIITKVKNETIERGMTQRKQTILAAGCRTSILLRIVAPSFVMMTSFEGDCIWSAPVKCLLATRRNFLVVFLHKPFYPCPWAGIPSPSKPFLTHLHYCRKVLI